MNEQHTYAGRTLAEIKAAAEAATPGPWKTVTDEHPHCRGGKHRERRIFTAWEHPQLRDFAPVVNGSVGIPAEKGGKPIHMVSIEANNADHIAAANPATVLAMAARIEELETDLQLAYETQHDLLHLIAEIRHACGDNGKRMQDELVEYVGEMAKDAGRYQWLRGLPKGINHHGMMIQICKHRAPPNDWVVDTVRREWMDEAIDAAMEQTKNREGV